MELRQMSTGYFPLRVAFCCRHIRPTHPRSSGTQVSQNTERIGGIRIRFRDFMASLQERICTASGTGTRRGSNDGYAIRYLYVSYSVVYYQCRIEHRTAI